MRKLTLTITVLLVSISCAKGERANEFKVLERKNEREVRALVEEKVHNIDIGEFIGALFVNDVRPGSLSFWITRKDGSHILSLNLSTRQYKEFYLKQGEGPEEFLNPRVVAMSSDAFFLVDLKGKKFVEYDTEFNFRRSTKIRSRIQISQPNMLGFKGALYSGKGIALGGEWKNYTRKNGRPYSQNVDNMAVGFDVMTARIGKAIYIHRTEMILDLKEPFITYDSDPLDAVIIGKFAYILDLLDYRILQYNLENENQIGGIAVAFERKQFDLEDVRRWTKDHDLLQKNWDGKQDILLPSDYCPALFINAFDDGIIVGTCEDYALREGSRVRCDFFDPDLNHRGIVNLPYYKHANAGGVSANSAYKWTFSKDGFYFQLQTDDEDEESENGRTLTFRSWRIRRTEQHEGAQ